MVYEPTYNLLSETDDLYAHESQILIKQIGGVDYLFLLYMSNKYAASEWQTVARARLRVFNLATKAHIRTWDLFYAGLVAGIQIPNNFISDSRYFSKEFSSSFDSLKSTLQFPSLHALEMVE